MYNWKWAVIRYNNKKRTQFKSSEDLLRVLYQKTQSVVRISEFLDVHYSIVSTEMDRLGIDRRRKNQPSLIIKKLLSIPKDELETMYIEEIAQVCRSSRNYMYILCRRYKLGIKRRPIGVSREGKRKALKMNSST